MVSTQTTQAQTAKRPPMKMTSVLLSAEDKALIAKLKVVVAATAGVATIASVIRYALRRAAEMKKSTKSSPPGQRRAGAKKKTVRRAPKRKNPTRRRTEKR